jgi:hypothetical protein
VSFCLSSWSESFDISPRGFETDWLQAAHGNVATIKIAVSAERIIEVLVLLFEHRQRSYIPDLHKTLSFRSFRLNSEERSR